MYKLGAVIPAAGLSSRMNRFKPLLPIGDKPLILRVFTMMRTAGAEITAIVTGFNKEAVIQCLKDENVVFVHNDDFHKTQMFESLLLGINAIGEKCERLLVCPGDVPIVLPETVTALLSANGSFVRPVYKGEPGHPVIISKEILPCIKNYKGRDGLRGAVESCEIHITEIETTDIGVVLDADRPEDYNLIVDIFEKRASK